MMIMRNKNRLIDDFKKLQYFLQFQNHDQNSVT